MKEKIRYWEREYLEYKSNEKERNIFLLDKVNESERSIFNS